MSAGQLKEHLAKRAALPSRLQQRVGMGQLLGVDTQGLL